MPRPEELVKHEKKIHGAEYNSRAEFEPLPSPNVPGIGATKEFQNLDNVPTTSLPATNEAQSLDNIRLGHALRTGTSNLHQAYLDLT